MQKKGRLFKKYFLFYLLIGVLPMSFFGAFYYFTSIANLQQQNEMEMKDRSQKILTQIDFLHDDMEYIVSNFSNYIYGNYYEELAHNTLSHEGEMTFVELIKRYEESFPDSVKIVSYVRGTQELITSDGPVLYESFINAHPDLELNKIPFFSNLLTTTYKSLLTQTIDFTKPVGKSSEMAFFFFPLPEYALIPKVSMAFLVENRYLKELAELYLSEGYSALELLNNKAQKVLYVDDGGKGVSGFVDEMALSHDASGKKEIEGTKYDFMNFVSDATGYKLCVTIDDTQFNKNVVERKRGFIFWISFLVFLDFILAYVLACLSYAPIGRLVKRLMKSDERLEVNEIVLLNQTLSDLLSKNSANEAKLDSQNAFLLSEILKKVIHGQFRDESALTSVLKKTNIVMKWEWFSIVLIFLSKVNEEEYEAYAHTICAFLSVMNDADCTMYPLDLGSTEGLCIMMNTKEEDNHNFVMKLQGELKHQFVMDFFIAVGKSYKGIIDTNLSYLEASLVAKQCKIGDVRFYDSDDAVKADEPNYPWALENLFVQAVTMQDAEAAQKALHEIFQYIETQVAVVPLQSYLRLRIVTMIIRTADELQLKTSRRLVLLSHATDSREFEQDAVVVAKELCMLQGQKLTEQKADLNNKILNFIILHFRDSQFSLTMVGDAFGKSVNYMSRFIKNETGISFVDYVTMLRFDWIKKQLVETDFLIQNIVQESGYSDISSFMRKFKAKEGMTPKQYRELRRQKSNK
jgi:YesN/AraC family two-component response regulator